MRFFHLDALSSTVGLKVDFEMALLVLASGLYRLLARRIRGYADCQVRQIFRDLVDSPAELVLTDTEVEVRLLCRAHLLILRASGLLDQAVALPWWSGRRLWMTS